MNLFKAIKSFFKKAPKEEARHEEAKKTSMESDFIDYDGMGNQGRFPSKDKKNK